MCIRDSPLAEDINLKELVQEAALFAVELTEGVNLVIDDITQTPDILH